MNYIISLITILAIAVVLGALSFLSKIKSLKLNIPRKIVAIALTGVAFVRYMIAEEKFIKYLINLIHKSLQHLKHIKYLKFHLGLKITQKKKKI